MQKIKIGDKIVGHSNPVYIIAEAGVNHNGSIDLAKRLIDVAKKSNADAVKFQTFRTENMVLRKTEKATYQKKVTSKGTQYDMLKKLELSSDDFRELNEYAMEVGITFLSSPFDRNSVDLLDEIGVPAFKIGSGELTNFPLLRHTARKSKPILLSTGMGTIGEIDEALKVIQNEGLLEVILLHCVTDYPAKIKDLNLHVIGTLKKSFQVPVGFSDHTEGTLVPSIAVALGASVIEKHYTLDKNMPGPDHKASLDPVQLREMVRSIRDVEKALGSGLKRPSSEEEKMRKFVRKSIVAKVDISKGSIIEEGMLSYKRPGAGLSPKYYLEIVGKKARKDIMQDDFILWKDVE
ncbi:MAG: N-acetylneuraminate synthase [Candidatus Hodarchaeota archaeon]